MKVNRLLILSSLLCLSILGCAKESDTKPYAKDVLEKGWSYFNQGDYETALKRFNQATVLDPEFAPGYFGKAYVYSVQNDLDLAILNYRKTIELANPPFSPAYSNLGLALLMTGETTEGHKMLLKALDIDPANGDAHVNIAQSFCDKNQNINAWHHISKAKELNAKVAPELLVEMKKECPST